MYIVIYIAHGSYFSLQYISTERQEDEIRNNLEVESRKHITFIIVNGGQFLNYKNNFNSSGIMSIWLDFSSPLLKLLEVGTQKRCAEIRNQGIYYMLLSINGNCI